MGFAKLKYGLALFLFLCTLGLYYKTLAPTATLVDSGELISACRLLDIAHPPGTPLYVLIGHLFSRLPWRSVGWRLNLMSAVFAALTVAAVFLLTLKASRLALLSLRTLSPPKSVTKKKERRGKAAKAGRPIQELRPVAADVARTSGLLTLAAPAVAALTFATSNTLWSYATVTEVYTLNTFLVALILLLAFRLAETTTSTTKDSSGKEAFLYPLALVFGLGLCVHHVSVLFLAPALAYFLFKNRAIFLKQNVILRAALFMALGLSIYAYLPVRAAQKPLLNWGNPSTFERFLWHVSGKQYQENFEPKLDVMIERFQFFVTLWSKEFTYLGAALILVGLFALWKRNRELFWFTLMILGFNLLYAVSYDISEDNEPYCLPSFVLCALWLGLGVDWLVATAQRKGKVWMTAALSVGLLLLLLSAATHYKQNDASRYYLGYDYAMNALNNMEPNGMLLTMDWQLYSPLLYFQNVERIQPDKTVIDVNMLRRSWYMDYLRRKYPWLIPPVADKVKAYLDQLYLFEHKLPYNPAAIQNAFVAVINGVIATNLASRPVYMTLDVLNGERDVSSKYFGVPRGVVFQLQPAKPAEVAPPGEINLRGFNDGSLPMGAATVKARKYSAIRTIPDVIAGIRHNYALMTLNRGIYLAQYNRREEAALWYKKAVEIDPTVAAEVEKLGR
jgi:tetratricopeptide (TPR) repeat protein